MPDWPPRRPRSPTTAASPASRPTYEVAALDSFDPATAELDPARGGAALADAFAEADAHGVEAHGIWTVAEQDQAWATAEGGGEERRTDAFMKVICIAPNGRSGYASQAAVAGSELSPGALAERAALKAAASGEPEELPPGEYPVVFEPQAVGWLLDLLGGTAFNGLAHAEGRGALDGRLGKAVAAAAINLSDSPTSAADAPALVRRRGHQEGAPAADPGRGRLRGRARRAQRRPDGRGEHRARALPRR